MKFIAIDECATFDIESIGLSKFDTTIITDSYFKSLIDPNKKLTEPRYRKNVFIGANGELTEFLNLRDRQHFSIPEDLGVTNFEYEPYKIYHLFFQKPSIISLSDVDEPVRIKVVIKTGCDPPSDFYVSPNTLVSDAETGYIFGKVRVR